MNGLRLPRASRLPLLAACWLTLGSAQADTLGNRADCEAAGGEWARFGLFQGYHCRLPAADAGRPCRQAGECTSVCYTTEAVAPGTRVQGHCYPWTSAAGACLNRVQNGVTLGIVCGD